jgi:hypothetical protein
MKLAPALLTKVEVVPEKEESVDSWISYDAAP